MAVYVSRERGDSDIQGSSLASLVVPNSFGILERGIEIMEEYCVDERDGELSVVGVEARREREFQREGLSGLSNSEKENIPIVPSKEVGSNVPPHGNERLILLPTINMEKQPSKDDAIIFLVAGYGNPKEVSKDSVNIA
ncbi:hypothetical protein ACH5RR_041178 [Cinchona calisaya]|uniref:Uncharacterized protein n=1 Tax=Cinchona calisaya TaxID=153742 RepID=A0ABD2XVE8_9GENT